MAWVVLGYVEGGVLPDAYPTYEEAREVFDDAVREGWVVELVSPHGEVVAAAHRKATCAGGIE